MTDLDDELSQRVAALSGPGNMAEIVSYNVFGAAVTTTRAFEKVTIKIEPELNRIFVAIRLRWIFRSKRFEPLHRAWLARAEKRCKEHAPTGWKILVYYERAE